MKNILYIFLIFFSMASHAQDNYKGKWSLGQNSGNKWYKIASFDFAGGSSFNSVNVNAEVNFVRTGQRGYSAKVQLFLREGAGNVFALWNYSLMGNEMGDVIKFKKVSPTVYELFAQSRGGNYGHLSIEMTVTKEQTFAVTIPTATTLVNNPDSYEEVSKEGNFSIVSGNLGIGVTKPDSKLTVAGKIHAQEVKVDLSEGVMPDYVFNKDYELMPLDEVEDYITNNGHLPGIPSANEVEANGLHLKQMNLKLLQKIEELTLYVLELKKENEKQNKTINDLKTNEK